MTSFVYGTLKRGCWNHDRFCRGVLSVEEAVVRGDLYEMPSGIPVLQVPEEDILARGTAYPLADVTTQARFAVDLASILEPVPESATAGDCGPMYLSAVPGTAQAGDPESRLPATCPRCRAAGGSTVLRASTMYLRADFPCVGVCWYPKAPGAEISPKRNLARVTH